MYQLIVRFALASSLLAVSGFAAIAQNTAATPAASESSRSDKKLSHFIQGPEFSSLRYLLDQADLEPTLDSDGPYTLFAPTNKALHRLPKPMLQQLVIDRQQLRRFLLNHLVSGEVRLANTKTPTTLSSMIQDNLKLSQLGGVVFANQAQVLSADHLYSNGVVHVLDEPLILTPKAQMPNKGQKAN